MERLSMYLSRRMVIHGLISEDDKIFYDYSIQVLLEKAIGIALILSVAAMIHHLLEVAAFLLVFASIRRYSDGIHCRTSLSCFCTSVLVSISTVPFVEYLPGICAIWIGGGCFRYGSIVHNGNSSASRPKRYRGGIALP